MTEPNETAEPSGASGGSVAGGPRNGALSGCETVQEKLTLTDTERLAICYAAALLDNLPWYQQKLRGLLERTQ